MWSFPDIAEALAAAAGTIEGLRVHGQVPGQVAPPAFVVDAPESVSFDVTMARGSDMLIVPCGLYVSAAHNRAGQSALYGYVAGDGPLSIKEALEVDPTLDGVISTLRVTEIRNFGIVSSSADNSRLLTCEFVVEVIT